MRLSFLLSLPLVLACMGMPSPAPTPTATPAPSPTVAATPEQFSILQNGIQPNIMRRSVTESEGTDPVVARRYVVKVRDEGAIGRSGVKGRGLGRKSYSVDTDLDEGALKKALGEGDVEWIEPVVRFGLNAYGDPGYKYQWNMQGLQVETVHKTTTGTGIIVAVVDSGVTKTPDGPQLLQGYDFVDNDRDASDSAAPVQSPTGSHGTHVANTIAEAAGNSAGCVGLAPGVRILPVRVGDYYGIDSDKLAEGIVWAADNGAQVINLSMGGNTASKVVSEAVAYAIEKGVVVVAATGNNGYDGKISYPAAYDGVIAVGAHDALFRETSYSNASRRVSILAPGGDTNADANQDGQPDGILQETIVGNKVGYAMMQGTSMAAPHVSAAAALLLSRGVKSEDVLSVLVSSAHPIQGKSYGALDVLSALSQQPVAGRGPRGHAPGGQEGHRPGVGRGSHPEEGRSGNGRPGRPGERKDRP